MKPEEKPPQQSPQRRRISPRAAIVVSALIIGAFLIGWMPKEIERRRLDETLRTTRLELRLSETHRQLGLASHEAMRNDFPAAGVAAMRFFEGCRTLAESGALDDRPRTRLALEAYAGSRDDVLGRLAAGDPTVREYFASLYLTMHGLIERRQ